MKLSEYLKQIADFQVRRWNAIVPKRAVDVRETPNGTHFEYLHPTKGWKAVSRNRVGF